MLPLEPVPQPGSAIENPLQEPLRVTDASAAPELSNSVNHSPDRPNPASLPQSSGLSVPSAVPFIVEVHDLDWHAIRNKIVPATIRSRIRPIIEEIETLLDAALGPQLLFSNHKNDIHGLTIQVPDQAAAGPLWIIGDLHGDWLALEAALALIHRHQQESSRIIFLGDLFDDGGFGLETVLRIFELIVKEPSAVCLIAGNHDQALAYDGLQFSSDISPSDFADFLNQNLVHEWIERAGKAAVRLFANAPRALFLPDGLLIAHGGFPLTDLHQNIRETGNWNDPACLSDFVWARAHPTARRKLPNRFTRGCQFGFEDFSDFCKLATSLGRPVSHMVRGHDHVEDRYAAYPAYALNPILTTVALSRRLEREIAGPHVRVPTVGLYVPGSLPQIYRLHIPSTIVHELYPCETSAEEFPNPRPEGET